jgi:hypothetical protein
MGIDKKFIDNFNIYIGQPAIGGLPLYDAVITFKINDYFVQAKLKDFKQWIDDICESRGNRSEKAYEAKKNLDAFFHDLLHPWTKLPEAPK